MSNPFDTPGPHRVMVRVTDEALEWIKAQPESTSELLRRLLCQEYSKSKKEKK